MKTTGERKVRTEFNPSKAGVVDQIKQKSAELINLVDEMRLDHDLTAEDGADFGRLKSLAITNYELAAMWAVKAATV